MCGSEDGSSPGVFLPVLIFFQLFVQPDGVGFHGDIVADPHQGQRQFQNTEQQETSPQRNAFKPSEESRARSVQDIRGHRPDGRAEGVYSYAGRITVSSMENTRQAAQMVRISRESTTRMRRTQFHTILQNNRQMV